MKNQFAKIVAVLMVLAMAVSVFGLCASAAEETTEANVLLLGDVNLDGKVTIQDATLIQKAIAKLATLDEVQTAVADATEDGNVNVKDATAIQKWIAKFEDANQNIGQPMGSTADEATKDEATTDEATKDEATQDEATADEATKDEATTDEATKDEETPVDPVDPATKDEETPVDPVDPATKDEATADETAYYLVGYINGADYGIMADIANLGEYQFVDGTVTVVLTNESYVQVKTADLTILGTESYVDGSTDTCTLVVGGGEKKYVPAGTWTFTFDAVTYTLSYTAA